MRWRISGTAAAASGMFTVMRTISEPASASAMHCAAVPAASVGVGAGHRLHDDRRAAADLHRAGAAADADADGTMHANHGHGDTCSGAGLAPRSAAVGPDLSAVGKDVQADEMLDDRQRLGRRIDEGEAGRRR